ncbi:outer membrane beta-barrel protein [Pedobacter heparinus]|uniref:outer membrane beta-barrel protein n=1 Tax=Pedobacter heparinus TaxID=984 RepID=UPI0029300395|nr:outer membrane beta-barrel protein [Pedobacter heparinus]
MKAEDDELIAHIRESLTEHEEAYLPGAWERFEKKERRGRGLLWLSSLSAAAVALIIGFALFNASNKTTDKETVKLTKTNDILPDKVELPDTAVLSEVNKTGTVRNITENLKTTVAQNEAVNVQRSNNNISNSPLIVKAKQPDSGPAIDSKDQPVQVKTDPVPGLKNGTVASAEASPVAETPVKTDPPRSFQEFLDAEVKTNPALAQTKTTAKKGDKWEMGLVVAPSIGNSKKLNMGYGVSMAYALSDKVSISSGISYSEMGASKDLSSATESAPNSPAGPSAMVHETKSLQSVDANLVGLDIPIEVKYYFNKKFYTNVGLSAFAVLSQKQNNNYLQGTVEPRLSDQGNPAGFNAVFSQKSVSEAVPSAEVRNDKYLGFYNISFGYKQQISDKRSLSVEPFLKLPVKEFTKENLYLLGTGIRLKFDF